MELWRTLGPFATASTGAFAGTDIVYRPDFTIPTSLPVGMQNKFEAVHSIKRIVQNQVLISSELASAGLAKAGQC